MGVSVAPLPTGLALFACFATSSCRGVLALLSFSTGTSRLYHRYGKVVASSWFLSLETLSYAVCVSNYGLDAFQALNSLWKVQLCIQLLYQAGLCLYRWKSYLGASESASSSNPVLELIYLFSPTSRYALKQGNGRAAEGLERKRNLAVLAVLVWPLLNALTCYNLLRQRLESLGPVEGKQGWMAVFFASVAMLSSFPAVSQRYETRGSSKKRDKRENAQRAESSTTNQRSKSRWSGQSTSRGENQTRSKSALKHNIAVKGENSYYFAHKKTTGEQIVYDGTPQKL